MPAHWRATSIKWADLERCRPTAQEVAQTLRQLGAQAEPGNRAQLDVADEEAIAKPQHAARHRQQLSHLVRVHGQGQPWYLQWSQCRQQMSPFHPRKRFRKGAASSPTSKESQRLTGSSCVAARCAISQEAMDRKLIQWCRSSPFSGWVEEEGKNPTLQALPIRSGCQRRLPNDLKKAILVRWIEVRSKKTDGARTHARSTWLATSLYSCPVLRGMASYSACYLIQRVVGQGVCEGCFLARVVRNPFPHACIDMLCCELVMLG